MSPPLVQCRDIFKAHYGKALKESQRNQSGSFNVYGSSGNIGHHDNTLTEESTVIIGRKGSVGEVTYAPEGGWAIDTAYYVELLDQKACDLKYLYYALKNSRLSSRTITTSIPGLNRDDLYSVKILLPILEVQKHIAAILDKADAIRRKRQQAIDLTAQLLRSVFLDMFGDPVTNPKGWTVEPLKSAISHANNGLSRRRKISQNIGDIVLRLQDVHYDGIRFDKELNRIQLDEKEKQRYRLEANDILFVRVNGNPDYVGRSAVFHEYNESVYHNDHLIRIKLSEVFNADFLCYLLNFPGSKRIIATKVKTSAGQHTISQGGIRELMFYRPPIELQNKFSAIKDRVSNIPYDSANIERLFSSLTQRAFRGELTKQTEAA